MQVRYGMMGNTVTDWALFAKIRLIPTISHSLWMSRNVCSVMLCGFRRRVHRPCHSFLPNRFSWCRLLTFITSHTGSGFTQIHDFLSNHPPPPPPFDLLPFKFLPKFTLWLVCCEDIHIRYYNMCDFKSSVWRWGSFSSSRNHVTKSLRRITRSNGVVWGRVHAKIYCVGW